LLSGLLKRCILTSRRRVGHRNSTRRQQIIDAAKAERELQIEPIAF
jgi:hypothetical protein